jgi:hypothetical protein
MKKLFLTALLLTIFSSSAWAVYCPVGGAIFHRSGEEADAIARCTEYIKQARASGQKIPDERSWRASQPWKSIANSQPYPLSWSGGTKEDKPTKQASRNIAVQTPEAEVKEKPADKPKKEVQERPAAKSKKEIRETPPVVAATKPPKPIEAAPKPAPEILSVLEEKPQPVVVAVAESPRAATETKQEEPQPLPVALPPAMKPERRIALVIGNGKYATHASLDNPRNDAEAVSATLREIGFQSVTTLLDGGRDKMVEALQSFATEAEDADWAMVYFAGHGIEVSGTNYLVPVDAKLKVDRDVQFEAVALDHVLSSVESARKLRLVALDACRDNPFISQMRRTLVSRSIGRGLAPIETDRSMLVFFAAKHGQFSLDRVDGNNSPFTTSLVRWMKEPGIEINKVLRHVRDDVLKVTQRSQEPYQYGSLSSDDFYFRPLPTQTSKN